MDNLKIMEEYIVLYNPTSGGGKGLAIAKKTQKFFPSFVHTNNCEN